MAQYWNGPVPAKCDLEREPIMDAFVDGKTIFGPWANMCPKCHQSYGIGLGTGKGQKYERQADGRFLKVEG